jgi:RNA polymerase sigma-70 factor (ECF subfamily)
MLKPLTQEQSDFAAEHHNLIYSFLHEKDYAADEYYDVAAFGYLKAVQKYHEREDLRVYTFSSIAFPSMRREMYNHFRSQRAQMRSAKTVPYDDVHVVCDTDSTWAAVDAKLAVDAIEARLAEKSNIIRLKTEGYSGHEIVKRTGIGAKRVYSELAAAREEITELIAA